MKIKTKKGLMVSVIVLACMSLLGCASSGNAKVAELNSDQAATMFVKGKTTQQQVRAQLGDPSDVDFSPTGNQKWIYTHIKSTSKATNFIPIVGMFVAGSDDQTKKLVIVFDKNGKMIDYMIMHSKGETKMGILG